MAGLPEELKDKRKQERVSRRAINTAILANSAATPEKRMTAEQIAIELNVPIQKIYDQTNRLRGKGLLKPANRVDATHLTQEDAVRMGYSPRTDELRTTAALDPQSLLQRVMAGEFVEAMERKKVLSIIIAVGADPYKLQAIKIMEDIEAAQDRGVGPPAPATDEETVTRLLRILQSAPEPLVKKAWAELHRPKEEIHEPVEAVEAKEAA